ncbi:MAG: PilZ domain-containing protein [Rhodocyclaceae bacterium]|nr:PilZ domain-containing protein [Rhodocyclaceae bacterium]MBR4736318.1 PilZ domain-containing protein [Rhodocyclaceae bacterium]
MATMGESRKQQRFITRRRGKYCFWVEMEGQLHPLEDLSIGGFAVGGEAAPEAGTELDFKLRRAADSDSIAGRAKVLNRFQTAAGPRAGVLFEALEGDGKERLDEWLIDHILSTASVPVSREDARSIVHGPSLV